MLNLVRVVTWKWIQSERVNIFNCKRNHAPVPSSVCHFCTTYAKRLCKSINKIFLNIPRLQHLWVSHTQEPPFADGWCVGSLGRAETSALPAAAPPPGLSSLLAGPETLRLRLPRWRATTAHNRLHHLCHWPSVLQDRTVRKTKAQPINTRVRN